MLEKLAAIADFADQNGEYTTANELTTLIKEAQFWDAVKTMLNPSSGELGEDASFWKRLTRGWKAGKFDRRLGLAFAINEEREKVNKKILSLSAPLKEFSAQVSAFYDKVRSGGDNYTAQDFKEELSTLKSSAGKMKNLIGGKDLRKALDLRNKLNSQQISAIEKIKGIDPQKKEFLIKLLRGEAAQQAGPAAAGEEKAQAPRQTGEYGPASTNGKSPEQKAIGDWLKLQKFPRREYDEGFTTPRSRGRASTIYGRYGVNPFVLAEFFRQNPDKKDEVMDLVGSKPFNKMFEDIRWAIELEKKEEEKKEIEKLVPGAPTAPETILTPTEEKEKVLETVKEIAREKEQEPVAPTPVAAPKSQPAPKPSDMMSVPNIPLLTTPPPATKKEEVRKSRTSRDKELARLQKAVEQKAKPAPTLPKAEEKTTRVESPADDKIVVTMAARTARQVTRLGRVQQLRKLADNMQADEDLLDVLDPLDDVGNQDLMFYGEDGEELDPEKDYSPEESAREMAEPTQNIDYDKWNENEIDPENPDPFKKRDALKEYKEKAKMLQDKLDSLLNDEDAKRKDMWKTYISSELGLLNQKIKMVEDGMLPEDEDD